jgi:hypothetical protein
MGQKEFMKSIKQCWNDKVTVETEQDTYTIEDGSYFVGGTKGTYMSELLGNVYYESLSSIALELYNYIVNKLKEKIINIY